MNRFTPAKLKLSKWTARQPENREKHFLVTDLEMDEAGTLLRVELQAVHSGRAQ
ncbi:TIGR02450 family Trp-rich protein [Pseudomonas resinovorans]|uniref:TIGR02450 family Trp-rich protein n=1 Tax=Metapseudomonas resinovorans TaxID=53412 RepID=A0ABT4YD63_METRE|nr:TIGR02450 family Trp-rich protein [Pseudomonas resinovorans]MDA8486825.1 TIGR02450 family Trp-rich protein [Pseudomonas resinovorans]